MPATPITQKAAVATQQAVQHVPTIWGRITAFFDRLGWDSINENVGGAAGFLRIGTWFGAGFAFGFLFKKYFNAVLTTVIIAVLLIKALEYQHVLVINWPGLKAMVGIESQANVSSSIRAILMTIKLNGIICIAAVGGFFVGNQLAA